MQKANRNIIILAIVAVAVLVISLAFSYVRPVNRGVLVQKANGLNIECKNNFDCKEYISYNTCEVFCARDSEANDNFILELSVTCDATLWDRPYAGECLCINKNCQYK